MKKVHITFDYELFFGSNPGTVENSIIKPTELLIQLFKKHDSTATFFIDYLMIVKMQNSSEKMKRESERIIEQLCRLVELGHRIELHIHPHWLDAKLVNDKWDFSEMSRYRLHSFTESEIITLFKEGKIFLERIAQRVVNDYTIRCFRAGGWCIQPFSKLKSAFKSTGIVIDSSVSFGAVSNSKNLKFDFTKIPNKELYHFEEDVEIEDVNGDFIEIPISYYNHGFIYRMVNQIDKIFYSSRYSKFGDGSHIGYGADNEPSKKRIFNSEQRMLSIDGIRPSLLLNILKKSKRDRLVIISHPKDITVRSLDTLNQICASKKFELTSL